MQRETSNPIELLQRYEFHKRFSWGRTELSGTRSALRSRLTLHRSAMHFNLRHMHIKRPCISISWILQISVRHHALPAEDFSRLHKLLKKGDHWILDKLVILERNVLNDLIVSHKLGHCDLFSYKFAIHVLYNNNDQFYIFFVVCCTEDFNFA